MHNGQGLSYFHEGIRFMDVHDLSGYDESFALMKSRLICELSLLEKSASYLRNQIILPLGI